MSEALCILSHQKPTSATLGLLCGGHALRLAEWLTDIGTWWQMLPALREPPQGDGNCRGRAVHSPSPIRLDVLAVEDMRTGIAIHPDDITGVRFVVWQWTRLVVEERDLRLPAEPAGVVGDIAILNRHHDWICRQTWVDDYATELRQAHTQMRAIVGLTTPPVIAHCPCQREQGACGGAMHQDRWGGMGVTCSRCGAHWDDADMRALVTG